MPSPETPKWRLRRLFNSPSGDFPGISPISSLKRVSWQLQVDQKTKEGTEKEERVRSWSRDWPRRRDEVGKMGFCFSLEIRINLQRGQICTTAKERHQRWQGLIFGTSKGSLVVLRQKRIRVTWFGQYSGNICPARYISVLLGYRLDRTPHRNVSDLRYSNENSLLI